MKHKDENLTELRALRRRANRRLGQLGAQTRVDTDASKQLHELQVYQVELEMQNAELRQIRAELHASVIRYTELYELAPVGYLTLDSNGTMLELNQAAMHLLGESQAQLRRQRLGSLVAPASRPAFNEFLASIFETRVIQGCEFELHRADGTAFFAQITAVCPEPFQTCLATIMDITTRREAARTLEIKKAEHFTRELLQQNRRLTRRMFELLENDRHDIVSEVHGEMGRWLAAIQARTAAMIRTEHTLQPETRSGIRAINASTAEMHNVMRRILLRLRPTILDAVGLTASLRELAQEWGERNRSTVCELTLEGDLDGLGESLNITIFRIIQEALTNAAKHARSRQVTMRVARAATEVSLAIKDDGRGFDPAAVSLGIGLLSMRERVIAMEGSFKLTSRPGQGVYIEVRLPALLDDVDVGKPEN